jgi:hypothetical protein
MPETIDLFNPARTPYVDTDLFGIGYGATPTPTYKGTLANLAAYLSKKLGTGQLTLVGNGNYVMQAADFELSSSVALTSSPTWTLVAANSVPAGQRRRIVDLAGVIVPGSFQIAVAPAGPDKINGVSGVFWLVSRFSHIIVESDGVSNWTIVDVGPSLLTANNLSDLPNVSTARGNLGLGTAAVHNITEFMVAANNLSEITVPNKPIARSNLGLGGLAVLNTVLYSNLDPAAIATLAQLLSGATGKLISSDVFWSSRVPVNLGTTSTNWDFNTFINGIYGPLSAIATVTASGLKAGQSGFITLLGVRAITFPSTFRFITTPTGVGSNGTNSFLEYWIESTSMVRARLTNTI